MQTIKKSKTYRMTGTALFISLGILLPFVTGHAFGIPGTILLPMHLPVLMAGLAFGWPYGLACGILTPLLSSLLTGMPPVYPMLPIMMLELCAYGAFSGLFYRKLNWPIYVSLPLAMIIGRIAYGLMFAFLTVASSSTLKAASVWTAILTGIPGIVVQLILIPALILIMERFSFIDKHISKPSLVEKEAIADISAGKSTCVVIKNNTRLETLSGLGVAPLLSLYDRDESHSVLKNAIVIDKVIGKAAAIILTSAKSKRVYGEIMSKSAQAYLQQHHIQCEYGTLVDFINNRTNTGMCPLEESVCNIDNPDEGLQAIRHTVAKLMAAKKSNIDKQNKTEHSCS